MDDPIAKQSMSFPEYLAQEKTALEKSIFWDGEVFGMAGASRRHNLLTAAMLGELRVGLRGRPCQPYSSDQRIRVSDGQRYVYPDASVTCKPVESAANDPDAITNPTLVVEVLSDSTEAFDRGDKFLGYRSLASLTDYLLVSQHAKRVEHFVRSTEGSWVLRVYESGSTLRIASLQIDIAVDALYEGVFDDDAEISVAT
jgi:Uma2 family endonuclease